jgi:putative endonuclease
MANDRRTLYIGVTSDLERRVWEHKHHIFEGFTKRYGLKKLVYIAEFPNIEDAIAWEKSLKGKLRAKKIGLIEAQNPRWNDLAWNWYDDVATNGSNAPSS